MPASREKLAAFRAAQTQAACSTRACRAAVSAASLPGATLGVLGGGQLGRMFVAWRRAAGLPRRVLDPGAEPGRPGRRRHLVGRLDDRAALDELARRCADASRSSSRTCPAAALDGSPSDGRCARRRRGLRSCQDRLAREAFLATRLRPRRRAVLRSDADARRGRRPALLPGILKTARLGYDGKGQVPRRAAGDDLARPGRAHRRRAVRARGGRPVRARGLGGRSRAASTATSAVLPGRRELHRRRILDVTVVPAPIAASAARRGARARRAASPRRSTTSACWRRDVRARRRRPARQRDRAAHAQQRALHVSTPAPPRSSSSRCARCAACRSATRACTGRR